MDTPILNTETAISGLPARKYMQVYFSPSTIILIISQNDLLGKKFHQRHIIVQVMCIYRRSNKIVGSM